MNTRPRICAVVVAGTVALFAATAAEPGPGDPIRSGGPASSRAVALTFDDGPGPRTAQIVSRLRRAGARATFFEIGVSVRRYPALARLAASIGEVGNHTCTHANLVVLPARRIRDELQCASAAIQRATGTRPRVFRPPYGRHDARVDAIARRLGMREVLWSVESDDWRYSDPRVVIERIRRQLRPGSIVLFHEQGRATLAALDWLLAELDRRHLEAVTVSELVGLAE